MKGLIWLDFDVCKPERNKYVLAKTPNCKYPCIVAFWNGVDWIEASGKTKILNVQLWKEIE